MTFLLDTNVCIRYLNGSSKNIVKTLRSLSPSDIAVCSIVKYELFYGAFKSHTPQKTLEKQRLFLSPFASYPFDDQAALEAGRIRALLSQQGKPIGPYDTIIAAIAVANNLTLVTHNIKEFSRIPNLSLDDWE